jgi:hypothetical protein
MAVAVARPWRASAMIVDAVTLLAVVACIPFAILAIGLPLALGVRAVLWIAQRF